MRRRHVGARTAVSQGIDAAPPGCASTLAMGPRREKAQPATSTVAPTSAPGMGWSRSIRGPPPGHLIQCAMDGAFYNPGSRLGRRRACRLTDAW
jgi:hypothetical protein